MVYRHGIVPVTRVRSFGAGYCIMSVEAEWIARDAVPGQFVNVRPGESYHPLLRRPFSICDSDGRSEVTFLFRVMGGGTELLSRRKPGETVDILGPQGHGYTWDDLTPGETVLLVGGGVGIPPLFFLSQTLNRQKIVHEVFLGVRNRDHVILEEEFAGMGQPLTVTSEDGSAGRKGFVTAPLLERLHGLGERPVRIFTCGPSPMLRALAGICSVRPWIRAQFSLEEHMSCSIGVCIGCVTRTVRGYERVCTEGPVFDFSDLVWDEAEPA